ncbi:hypothetical protein pb186bvf_000122 [Paramecium bursaria]
MQPHQSSKDRVVDYLKNNTSRADLMNPAQKINRLKQVVEKVKQENDEKSKKSRFSIQIIQAPKQTQRLQQISQVQTNSQAEIEIEQQKQSSIITQLSPQPSEHDKQLLIQNLNSNITEQDLEQSPKSLVDFDNDVSQRSAESQLFSSHDHIPESQIDSVQQRQQFLNQGASDGPLKQEIIELVQTTPRVKRNQEPKLIKLKDESIHQKQLDDIDSKQTTEQQLPVLLSQSQLPSKQQIIYIEEPKDVKSPRHVPEIVVNLNQKNQEEVADEKSSTKLQKKTIIIQAKNNQVSQIDEEQKQKQELIQQQQLQKIKEEQEEQEKQEQQRQRQESERQRQESERSEHTRKQQRQGTQKVLQTKQQEQLKQQKQEEQQRQEQQEKQQKQEKQEKAEQKQLKQAKSEKKLISQNQNKQQFIMTEYIDQLDEILQINVTTQDRLYYYLQPGNNSLIIKKLLAIRKIWVQEENINSKFLSLKWLHNKRGANFEYQQQNPTLQHSINHFEYQWEFSDRLKFYETFNAFLQTRKKNIWDYMPIQFNIDFEGNFEDSLNQMYFYMQKMKQWIYDKKQLKKVFDINIKEPKQLPKYQPTLDYSKFILKPSNMADGKGHQIVNNFEDIVNYIELYRRGLQSPIKEYKVDEKGDIQDIEFQSMLRFSQFVIQHYLSNSMLINNKRFSLKFWVLINHYDDSFISRDGIVHFTENSRQSQYLYSSMQGQIEKQVKIDDVEQQLKEITYLACCAAKIKLNPNTRPNTFEIFQFEFMLDDKGKVFLIDINSNVKWETPTQELQQYVPLLINDALKLTVDLIFPHNDVKFDLNSNWDRLRK